MLNTFFLATKLLWREWRRGEWLIVFLALVLASSATTAIHFYSDRLLRGLEQQSAKFLGGDLAVSSSSPIPSAWQEKAAILQLKTAEVWSYPSVISAKNKLQLVNLQAVSSTYPLTSTSAIRPESQTIWVEPRLLTQLVIHLDDKVTIGAADFRVAKILTPDLDTLNTGWTIAPRVLMRLDDVAATQTVLPGSRVDYRLLLVGAKNNIQAFKLWITPQLQAGQRLLDIDSQSTYLKDILQKAGNYLQLIILICLLMNGIAIAFSIQQYLRHHYDQIALSRCLGAKRQQIITILVWQLIIVAMIAGTVGIVIGLFAQHIFAELFNYFVQFSLPAPSSGPVYLGFVISVALLFAFSLPVIVEITRISPLFLWRNEIKANSLFDNMFIILTWIVILTFVYWFMDFSKTTLFFFNLILLSIAFLYGLCLAMLGFLRTLLSYCEGPIRRGLSQLVQHAQNVTLQFISFTLILVLLIVLGLIKNDLIKNWLQSLPNYSPNYFAFNIALADLNTLQQLLNRQHIAVEGIYPVVRGRITALNDQPIMNAVPQAALQNNALHRELNLSWMWKLPSDNKVIAGANWTTLDAGKFLVSIESKLATDMHLHLGDKLTFQIGDKKISAIIANFRSLEWSSFHPNFFIIFPPGALATFPTTYITSFHLQPNQVGLLNQLVQRFPNMTIIDVASLLQQMQNYIAKTATALQTLFLFALGAGGLIFIASLQASMDERRQIYYLLRVLGASKKYIQKSVVVEFTCLLLLILLSSIILSWMITFLLERSIFNM